METKAPLQKDTAVALAELGKVVTSSLDEQVVVQRVLDQVSALLGAEGVVVLLRDGEELVFVGVSGPGAVRLMGTRMPANAGIVGHVAQTGESVWRIGDRCSVERLRVYRKVEAVSGFRMESLLAAPLMDGDRILGVLEAAHSRADAFRPEDITLLEAAASWAAIALRNAKLHEQAQRARERQASLEERARLARDLHDAVTQSLYSVVVLAEAWRRKIDTGQLTAGREHIDELGEAAAQALRETRLIVYELRPSEIAEEGLLGALSHRLAAVEERAGIKTQLEVFESGAVPLPDPAAVDLRLSQSAEMDLYRIAQEALNNALYHAQADEVIMVFQLDDEKLSLEIRDDGRGFDTADIGSGGFGIANMTERTEQLGGRFSIESAPGFGTVVGVGNVARMAREPVGMAPGARTYV